MVCKKVLTARNHLRWWVVIHTKVGLAAVASEHGAITIAELYTIEHNDSIAETTATCVGMTLFSQFVH